MTDWTYGEEGRAFEVKVGEVWQVSGDHIFVCSDLMASDLYSEVIAECAVPTILYSDPPWGQSLANSFRTKAGLEKASYRWTDLYTRIASIGHHYRIPIWVECSSEKHKDGQQVPLAIAAETHPYRDYAELVYYGKNPMGLFYAGPTPAPSGLCESMRGVDDDYTPGMVMEAYGEGGLVIDPCAGRGMTSRNAFSKGWASINNELNPHRVSASLVRLAKLSGIEPERVS